MIRLGIKRIEVIVWHYRVNSTPRLKRTTFQRLLGQTEGALQEYAGSACDSRMGLLRYENSATSAARSPGIALTSKQDR